ncbi:molecular chaperone TorD family protein [Persephonella sp. IF05-L8]|uniref:molecular chaperone TorD family protein n=1 Tax=Persephonella sp. IF05-L8 TaxID=1158338 RepID=UPI0004981567
MEERIQETQARINMYGLLSRLFIEEIDEETLKKIKETPELLELFPKTKEWDKFNEKDIKSLIEEDLNVDFTTVFLLNVYPYESVFMNDEGHIDASITNPTLVFYREHGYSIDLNETRALSPDHIAVEMEFMMTVAKEELDALQKGNKEEADKLREIQKKFLEEHLANWGTIYLLAAKDMAETPFYQDVCELALEFILSDYDYLAEAIEEATV